MNYSYRQRLRGAGLVAAVDCGIWGGGDIASDNELNERLVLILVIYEEELADTGNVKRAAMRITISVQIPREAGKLLQSWRRCPPMHISILAY